MATEKKIVVTIGKEGDTKIEAFGFTGSACLQATKSLEEALGKVTEREKKPEMYSGDVGDKAVIGHK